MAPAWAASCSNFGRFIAQGTFPPYLYYELQYLHPFLRDTIRYDEAHAFLLFAIMTNHCSTGRYLV